MPKIFCHNINLRCGRDLAKELQNIDQRAVVCANKGDIVLTHNRLQPEFLDYISLLGFPTRDILFLSPSHASNANGNMSIIDDESLAEFFSQHGNKENFKIDVYEITPAEKKFSFKINIPIDGFVGDPTPITKSGFRKMARRLGFSIAPGFEDLHSIGDIRKSIVEILKDNRGGTVALKFDHGIGSYGIARFGGGFLKKNEKEQARVIDELIGVIGDEEGNFVVEEWIPDVVGALTLRFFDITRDGHWEDVVADDHIAAGTNHAYLGCVHPTKILPPDQVKKIVMMGDKFLKELVGVNYLDSVSFDLIVTADGKIFWTEINFKKGGCYYAHNVARRLVHQKNNFYIQRIFQIPELVGYDFDVLLKTWNTILFPINSQPRGVVFFNTGSIKSTGIFNVVCLGLDSEDTSLLWQEFLVNLQKFRQDPLRVVRN